MRTIGIDVSVTAPHKAVVVEERGNALTTVLQVRNDPAELEALVNYARQGAAGDTVQVVMEPTGLAWLPLACYFIQRGVTVYLVNTQQTSDLRKFYRKHAKSDRIDCRVLARLPLVNPDKLHPLHLADADHLSGQRWCRQQEVLTELITAVKNRVQSWERAFWPGLEEAVGDLFAPWMQRFRQVWYDPWQLTAADGAVLARWLAEAGADQEQVESLAAALQQVARRSIALFGTPDGRPSLYVDYATLQDQVLRELRLLAIYQVEHQNLQRRIRALYRQVHPSRHLETIKGVGDQGAPVFAFFIADVERFAGQKSFRGWSGMVPRSDQSGEVEKKGLPISQAGPDIIKKYAYIAAETARQWDPQIAAIYYDQMVNKGKHHIQAVCCCATHLLDRVRAVLRYRRPYEVRDVDGRPVTWQEARDIIAERYQVPEEVRRRNTQRARKARRDARAERKQQKRRSRPRTTRGWRRNATSAGADFPSAPCSLIISQG